MHSDEIRGHGKETLTNRLLLSNKIYLNISGKLHDRFLTGLKSNFRKVAYKAEIQGAVG